MGFDPSRKINFDHLNDLYFEPSLPTSKKEIIFPRRKSSFLGARPAYIPSI